MQRNRPAEAGSAAGVFSPPAENAPPPPPRRRRSSAPIPLVPAEGPPDEVWNDYFRTHSPDPPAVCDIALRLHKAGKVEELIACLEAAIIHGQSQPWMFTVLPLAMERAGRPKDEIERVVLSGVDFSAVNVSNLVYAAAFLSRFGFKDRALEMYRQASAVDPTRLEPYALGLKHAFEAQDPVGVEWATTGILLRAWNKDHKKLQADAIEIARKMEELLRSQDRSSEADHLAQTVAAARERDLYVELLWSGRADLDLIVEEPGGGVCSPDHPHTTGGGIYTYDGMGAGEKDSADRYVCPVGLPGEYRLIVQHVSGDVVGKRAVLKIVRYQGSDHELKDEFTIPLGEADKSVRITLQHGRLKELAAIPLLDVPAEERSTGRRSRREIARRTTAVARQMARPELTAGQIGAGGQLGLAGAPAGVGYQPIITVVNEGVTFSALAVVSGDRRYVRLTLSPVFNAITDVQLFSFVSGGGSSTGVQTGGGTGGTGGGRP